MNKRSTNPETKVAIYRQSKTAVVLPRSVTSKVSPHKPEVTDQAAEIESYVYNGVTGAYSGGGERSKGRGIEEGNGKKRRESDKRREMGKKRREICKNKG